jgi:hypothetical protein
MPRLGPESADLAAFDDEEVPAPIKVAAPPPPPPPPPISAAVSYLFESGDVSRQYRVATELVRIESTESPRFDTLPLSSPTALRLALTQRADAGWGGGALTLPAPTGDGVQGVGLIPGLRRLLELGWDADSPPIHRARRVLFRLISEDDDPALRFEFAGSADRAQAARQRLLLREAAAATLAHAGLESDPRLRGAAHRLLDRVMAAVRLPSAPSPWSSQGKAALLAPDVVPPSVFFLQMLAFMPHFRSEQHRAITRLLPMLTRPVPAVDWVQKVGAQTITQPYLVAGDPLAAPHAPDLPTTLGWLELFARLGVLRRHAPWGERFDALLAERDAGDAVWRPSATAAPPAGIDHPAWWHTAGVGEGGRVDWSREVTFRLALIARLSGRQLAYW